MDWLKDIANGGKGKKAKRIPKQAFVASQFPKGVPKSFLQQGQYQFPKTTNLKWVNPELLEIKEESIVVLDQAEAGTSTQVETQVQHQEIKSERYSPTDIYSDKLIESMDEDEECEPDTENMDCAGNSKNVFDRLGPPQPKIPNLTINLQYDNDHVDRKVSMAASEDPEKYTPVHLRKDILASKDPIVMKYLSCWPWRKLKPMRSEITAKSFANNSKYGKKNIEKAYAAWDTFVHVAVTGYPPSWNMDDVMEAVLGCVKRNTFIPCFIEFSKDECKFLVLESPDALLALHDYDLSIRRGDVTLDITIYLTYYTLEILDFPLEGILRKLITAGHDGQKKVSLSAFTNKKDIRHFIYFPLNRINNQEYLMRITDTVAWESIVELDLSHNKLTSLVGFNLSKNTPKLKHLDVSHNLLDKLTALVSTSSLLLDSIVLEGNPVCSDYRDPMLYVEVIRKIYPSVKTIDGVQLAMNGVMPTFTRNYCTEDERNVVNMLLEIYFPILESPRDQRQRMEKMYDHDAVLTVTYRSKLRRAAKYQSYQDMLLRARCLEDGKVDSLVGAAVIAKHIASWPDMEYDPVTFTVDVLHHTAKASVIRVDGLVKLTKESLADEHPMLAFTKTFVLKTTDGREYKVCNQMVYWDEPTEEFANNGFKVTTMRNKKAKLQLDCVPDDYLKVKYVEIFMKLTYMNRSTCIKCLEKKKWHFKNALEHFVMLLKENRLESLT